jgi:tetratricopeptide (TPR) repeat protein
MKNLTNLLSSSHAKFASYLLLGATALTPFLVFPLGDNLFIDPKVTFFFLVGILAAALWIATSVAKKSIQITLSPFLLPLLLLGGVTLISSLTNGNFPVHHLLGIGGVYLTSVALVVFGSSLLSKKSAKTFLNILLVPTVVLAITSIAELLKVGPSFLFGQLLQTEFPHSPLFSLSGSPLFTAQFLVLALAGIAAALWTNRKSSSKVLYIFPGIIALVGLAVQAQTLLQMNKTAPLMLPYSASYYIATDTLKSAKSAIIGVGPEYFLHSYLQYRPGWLNASPLWNTQFTQGSSFPFTLLVTLGITGLLSWLFLAVIAARQLKNASAEALPAAVVFCTALLLEIFFPINIVLIAIQTFALIFWIAAEKGKLKDVQLHAFTVEITQSGEEVQKVPKHSNVMVYLMAAIFAIATAYSAYWVGRGAIAQAYSFQANMAAAQNKAIDSYELQKKAIQFNPYTDAYRRKYSLTNMAIASAISASPEATDEDKQKIVVLIQQAIREAKTATELDPYNSSNWLTLASIYNNLIGVADGAENWSAAAYQQAMQVSPLDPLPQLEVGALLYRFGQYAQATQMFEKAATLKPDLPNTYYLLAKSYAQQKRYSEAAAAYQQAMTLLSNAGSTDDYNKVKAELEELQKMAQEAPATTTQTQQQTQKPAATVKPTVKPTPSPTASSSTSLSPAAKEALQGAELEGPGGP